MTGEAGGLGDPRDANADGTVPERPETEDPSITPVTPETTQPSECIDDRIVEIVPPTPKAKLDEELGESAMLMIQALFANAPPKPIFGFNAGHRSILSNVDMSGETRQINPGLSRLDLFREPDPKVDGTEYVKDAFGGFGPGSPEYDDNGQRLQIVVPNPKDSVRWFSETEIEQGSSFVRKKFEAHIPDAKHPAIESIAIEFTKTHETSLVSSIISTSYNAFSIPDAPKTTSEGMEIDITEPAIRMLKDHLATRLEELHPGKTSQAENSGNILIEIDEATSLYVNLRNLPYLNVTVNGEGFFTNKRFGQGNPNSKDLQRELAALQVHLPGIAEAHADFFRKQLPKTVLEVDYSPIESSSTGSTTDPTNPSRLRDLRQELLSRPDSGDFEYIGGLDKDIAKMRQAALGFAHPEAFREFGVNPPRGILLQGPPGTGKTSLAMAFASEAEAVVLTVKASTIKNAFHGETERNMGGVFQLADQLVQEGEKVVIFIDEIEAIAPARDSLGSSNIDKNVTTELLQRMNVDRPDCIIIAATNVPGMVDPALTNNSSRFSEQLEIGLPDTEAREDIINKLLLKFTDKSSSQSKDILFEPELDIKLLANESEGLSGADLENAIRKVLLTKAVLLATTGERPEPVSGQQIFRSLKDIVIGKGKTSNNYLA